MLTLRLYNEEALFPSVIYLTECAKHTLIGYFRTNLLIERVPKLNELTSPSLVATAAARVVSLIVAIGCLGATTASAQTNVSGRLAEDQDHHWTIDGSPYIIMSTVSLISRDRKLTIDAGVEVRGASRTELRIHGTLEVNGTEENPVVFTSDNPFGKWDGIYLGRAARPSRISGANIRDAQSQGIISYADDLLIEHSVIENNGQYNLRSAGDRLRISRSRFADANQAYRSWSGTMPRSKIRYSKTTS